MENSEIIKWVEDNIGYYDPDDCDYKYTFDQALLDVWYNFVGENESLFSEFKDDNGIVKYDSVVWDKKEFLLKEFEEYWNEVYK